MGVAVTQMPRWSKGLVATKKGWGTEVRHRTDFEDLKSQFMKRCEKDGLAEPTKDLYRLNIRKFFTYLQDECGRKYWQQVTRDDVNGFITHYQSLELSEHSKHQVFRNLKTLMKWMQDQDCYGDVPHLKDLPELKNLKGRMYLPSPPELNQFIESFDKDTIWGFRDYVVSSLILGCGARIGEICNMVPDDIKWDMGMVRLFGKGKKERIVPVEGDEVFPLLKQWMLVRNKYARGTGKERVFINRAGGKCQPNTFVQAFAKHRRRTKLGITENGVVSPHILRHFFCTYFLIDGGPIEMLQRITGHEDIQTLMNYVHLANQLNSVKEAHTRVSPLKSLRQRANAVVEKRKRRMY